MSIIGKFNDFVNRFYDDYFRFNPTLGRQIGFNRYLGKVPDFCYENVMGIVKRLQFYQIEVNRLRKEDFTSQQKADLVQLELTINYERFQLQQLRNWAENPMSYSGHLDVSHYLLRNYAPLKTRLKHTIEHLSQIERFLTCQKYNLIAVQPKINLKTTLEMYQGFIEFYTLDVPKVFKSVTSDSSKLELEQSIRKAVQALEKFLTYGEKTLLPDSTDEFFIGRFNFIDMLRFGEMVEIDLDSLLTIGETDLQKNKKLFEEIASKLMPGISPRDVMLSIAKDHPSSDKLIGETRDMLENIRQFLLDHDIVSVPSEVRIQVAETPGFLRWAFAMCDTPGPFEKTASESFYYVTNVLPEWSDKEKEEWLTKFDYATLDNVSVHEAYPGHFIHYLHTLSAPSKVSKIEGAYSFWEGWAHYSEQMMIEEGWHKNDPRYHLAQLSEALLRDCRFICAIKMHTQNMKVDEATQYFMENSYMEETPARKEAERGTFDPGYLNYTLGKLMMLKLRDDWKAQEGDNYSLKRFHDTVLSFGAPPIPMVRMLMLKEDDGKIL